MSTVITYKPHRFLIYEVTVMKHQNTIAVANIKFETFLTSEQGFFDVFTFYLWGKLVCQRFLFPLQTHGTTTTTTTVLRPFVRDYPGESVPEG